MIGMVQTLLFLEESELCSCGKPSRARGLCQSCYFAAWHSEHRFSGNRILALERDGYRCRVCGEHTNIVHHRRGDNDLDHLIALCGRCHARVHHLQALTRVWVSELMVDLWAEQHPREPVQLQLIAA